MGLIVDTTLFVNAERAASVRAPLLPNIASVAGEESVFGVSALTLTEISYEHARSHRLTPEEKDACMRRLRFAYDVHTVTAEIAIRAGQINAFLHRNGTTIGLADVLIAATALELGFGVLTHNIRHFNYVPELRVVNAAAI